MASVRDCSALADAQPVEVTNASMPWFMSSQAGEEGQRSEGLKKGESGEKQRQFSRFNVDRNKKF